MPPTFPGDLPLATMPATMTHPSVALAAPSVPFAETQSRVEAERRTRKPRKFSASRA